MTEYRSNFEVRPNFGDPNCHVCLAPKTMVSRSNLDTQHLSTWNKPCHPNLRYLEETLAPKPIGTWSKHP